MKRREFLRSIECLAAAALCAGLPASVAGCSGFRYVQAQQDGRRLLVRRAAFGDGPYALLEHPQIPRAIYLRKQEGNSFSAVLTRCMHQGCQVEPAGDRLACPCHGSEYSLTGEVLRGPTERPLLRYDVTADDNHIYIHLSDLQ